ncbi:MAG: hypothetical protein KUL88_04440 [Rhizobium sp.]|nr:hypothetical protein [Rhizobium sp.]
MTASPAAAALSPARALIARLETLAEEQDELHRRLVDTLKAYAEASETYLEAIERQIERTAHVRAAVVVEAAFLVAEHEDEAAGIGRLYSSLRLSPNPPGLAMPRRPVQ